METMAEVLLQRETVEGEAVNALLDGTWDEYVAKHPEVAAEKPAEAEAEKPADAESDAPASDDAPEQDPTERNTNVD